MTASRQIVDALSDLNDHRNPGDPFIEITEELVNQLTTVFEKEITELESCEMDLEEFQQLLIEFLKPE